ncbi:MAG: GH3 auxin-responsive promoter family protein [Phycisphaerales bacterium]|nr:GH3 auxin-responsive promoter family protein [Phycisphaerales bacterium]
MPTLIERILARVAFHHARRTFQQFERACADVDRAQQQALQRALAQVRGSRFWHEHRLGAVRTPADLRSALPLHAYENLRPVLERVADGDVGALLARGAAPRMFATSSGTTARTKLIPVTPAFIADYRRGWNTFGLKMLLDHPDAVLRHILQSSGRHDESRSAGGVPCGAITGLLARSQKRIVRRFYVGTPTIAAIRDTRTRQYVLMRSGIARDVAFAVTANPATLVQLARLADEQSESLIRDVRDGALSADLGADEPLRPALTAGFRPDPAAARRLEQLRDEHGALRPRDYWRLSFLACWTGGSMGHYLPRVREWYGDLPIRDVGLLASEGRVSLPLDDNTPVGVLDVTSALFEFLPIEAADRVLNHGAGSLGGGASTHGAAATLSARELEVGRDYVVILSNTTGLLRYRLDDVVRVHGWWRQCPLVEFLHRAGRVASVAGEKLTENQVVAAVAAAAESLNMPTPDFMLAPVWGDPPHYRLSTTTDDPAFGPAVDRELSRQNSEYAGRREGGRLGRLSVRPVSASVFAAMDARLVARQGATAEQYKRPCLVPVVEGDDQALGGDAKT